MHLVEIIKVSRASSTVAPLVLSGSSSSLVPRPLSAFYLQETLHVLEKKEEPGDEANLLPHSSIKLIMYLHQLGNRT